MKFIENQFSLWRIVIFVGVTAIAIPIAASLRPSVTAVEERQEYLVQATGVAEDTDSKSGGDSKAVVGKSVVQDYYWDRRRQYWEDRLEDDLDDEDGEDEADSKDSKDAKDDEADDDGFY